MNNINIASLKDFYSKAMSDEVDPTDHSNDAQSLIDFYSGKPDAYGRTLAFILAQDDKWLEASHNWVQWLFPLPEASFAVPNAPIADASVYEFLAHSATMKATSAIDNAFERFISFLGIKPFIEFHSEGWKSSEPPWWWKQGNHNALRVSRAIRCLDFIPTTHAAYFACTLRLALRAIAIRFPDGVSNQTLHYWRVLILGREMKDGAQ